MDKSKEISFSVNLKKKKKNQVMTLLGFIAREGFPEGGASGWADVSTVCRGGSFCQ